MSTKEEVQENRLWNTRQLVRGCGGVNEAARLMKRKNSYVTAIAGPNPSRPIGDRTAALIENTFGLAPGALDATPPRETTQKDKLIAQICATLANASDTDKEFILHMSEWIVKRSLKSAKTPPSGPIQAGDVS